MSIDAVTSPVHVSSPAAEAEYPPELAAAIAQATRAAADSTSAPVSALRHLYELLKSRPSLLNSLLPPAASALCVTLYLAEQDPSQLALRPSADSPLPWPAPHQTDMQLSSHGLLHCFVAQRLRATEAMLLQWKGHKVTESHLRPFIMPVPPSDADVRTGLRFVYVLLRGLADSRVAAYLQPDPKHPNKPAPLADNINPGYSKAVQSPLQEMDARIFPHLSTAPLRTHAPALLVEAAMLVHKHVDVFVWPPPRQKDEEDEDEDACRTHIAATRTDAYEKLALARTERDKTHDALVQKLVALNSGIAASAQQSLPDARALLASADRHSAAELQAMRQRVDLVSEATYLLDASPRQNLMALVSLFQSTRALHPPHALMLELLWAVGAPDTSVLQAVRASKPRNFSQAHIDLRYAGKRQGKARPRGDAPLIHAAPIEQFLLLLEACVANKCSRRVTKSFGTAVAPYLERREGRASPQQLMRLFHCIAAMEIVTTATSHFMAHFAHQLQQLSYAPHTLLTLPALPLNTRQPAAPPPDPFEHHYPPHTASTRSLLPVRLISAMHVILVSYASVAPLLSDVLLQPMMPVINQQLLAERLSAGQVTPARPLARALCDYFVSVLADESMTARHTELDGTGWNAQLLLLTEVHELAYALVLLQMDHFDFAQALMRAYTRLADSTLPRLPASCWRSLASSMRHLSTHMRIRDTPKHLLQQGKLVPAGGAGGFHAVTESMIRDRHQRSRAATLSQFQLRVQHILRDPTGLFRFVQELESKNAGHRVMAAPHQLQQLMKREKELAQHSDAYDRKHPVRMHIEYQTEAGWQVDVALFAQRRVTSADIREQHERDTRRALAVPALRSALHTRPRTALPLGSLHTVRVALEIDGPQHFCADSKFYRTAHNRLKLRQLHALGWHVVTVPHFLWNTFTTDQQAALWLQEQLPACLFREE